MKTVFAPDAVADLEAIFDYIARDNALHAGSFTRALRSAALEIADHPFAWPLIPRYEKIGYRRRVFRGYLIFYGVSDSQLTVLRILNGMQDYERHLFPEDER